MKINEKLSELARICCNHFEIEENDLKSSKKSKDILNNKIAFCKTARFKLGIPPIKIQQFLNQSNNVYKLSQKNPTDRLYQIIYPKIEKFAAKINN